MDYEVKGLNEAQRAYDNFTPGDESPLYHCDSCGDEIYEGDEAFYNYFTERWYCSDCIRRRTAEREEYEE